MATKNDRKRAAPARKPAKAGGQGRRAKPSTKTAGKAVRAPAAKRAKPNRTARRGTGRAAGGGLIALGFANVFGARYRVSARTPPLVRRELRGGAEDKADIDIQAGGTVRWSAPASSPFRIQFKREAPNVGQPGALSFRSRLVSGKQRVEVTVLGHPFGTRLEYDIFSPPDAATPLDPSLIIYPNAALQLDLA